MEASTQSVIALSSGEAEYYALVKGSGQAIGMCSMIRELGVPIAREFNVMNTDENNEVEIGTDSAVAKCIASRRGTGKIRHIDVAELWLQEKVASGLVKVIKVKGEANPADALTKYVGARELLVHCSGANVEKAVGRHALSPKVTSDV